MIKIAIIATNKRTFDRQKSKEGRGGGGGGIKTEQRKIP